MSVLSEQDLAFLRDSLPFWNSLTEMQQHMVERSVSVHAYPAGGVLHTGPADCAGLFLIKTGQVRTYILSETGREITLFRMFPGELCLFSASCMFKNIRFDVTIDAVQESEAILIPTNVYNELNKTSLAVSDYTNQLISSLFSEVMFLMEQILFMSFDRRLALYLLKQSAIERSDRIRATHETIAKDTASAREVVTRMLRYFQDEGMVKLSRGAVAITDRKKLEALAS